MIHTAHDPVPDVRFRVAPDGIMVKAEPFCSACGTRLIRVPGMRGAFAHEGTPGNPEQDQHDCLDFARQVRHDIVMAPWECGKCGRSLQPW